MVNASKILTVSYGTFSCTLEGFDDPFSTMRSIAEYFRDLAADDRYFGAEPPTPDAEMLHRIAEREIQRRVESRVSDNGHGVVLRQVGENRRAEAHDAGGVAVAQAPAVATPVAKPRPQRTAAAEDTLSETVTQPVNPGADRSSVITPEDDDVDNSVAAKLRRIRAAVARSRAEPEPLLNAAFAEDETADPLYDDATDAARFDEPATALADLDEAPVLDDLDPDANDDDEMDITSFLDGNALPEDDAAPEVAADTPPETEDKEPVRKDRAPETDVEAIREMAEDELELKRQDAASANARADLSDRTLSADELDPQLQDDMASASFDDDAEDMEEAQADEDHKTEADALLGAKETAPSNVAAVLDSAATFEDFDLLGDDTADADDQEVNIAAMLDGLPKADVAEVDEAVETVGEFDLSDLDDALDEDLDDLALLDAPTAPKSEPAEKTTVAIEDQDEDSLDLSEYFDNLDAQEKELGLADNVKDLPANHEDLDEDEDEPLNLSAHQTPAAEDTAEEEAKDEAEESRTAPRVRVIKMRREEFEAQFEALDEDDEDQDEDELSTDEDNIREVLGDTGLSAEDEDDLIKELAEVERTPASAYEDESDFDDVTNPIVPEAIAPKTIVPQRPQKLDPVERIAKRADADRPSQRADTERSVSRADDASVDRLLARADTALEEHEGTRRRSAIAHLKAAVAAVRADGGRSKRSADAETARAMDQFRDDLAHVVRPDAVEAGADQMFDDEDDGYEEDGEDLPTRAAKPEPRETPKASANPVPRRTVAVRPSSTKELSDRRERRRMPPLMLVSEQRVDKPADDLEPAAPVRPRRIRTQDLDDAAEAPKNEVFTEADTTSERDDSTENFFTDPEDFKAYITQTRAEGLKEMLEASLAFGLFVEGAEHNSRPQIMSRVMHLNPNKPLSREESLRAFGVLLREGRINRLKRAQFVLASSSRFVPKAKSEAG